MACREQRSAAAEVRGEVLVLGTKSLVHYTYTDSSQLNDCFDAAASATIRALKEKTEYRRTPEPLLHTKDDGRYAQATPPGIWQFKPKASPLRVAVGVVALVLSEVGVFFAGLLLLGPHGGDSTPLDVRMVLFLIVGSIGCLVTGIVILAKQRNGNSVLNSGLYASQPDLVTEALAARELSTSSQRISAHSAQ